VIENRTWSSAREERGFILPNALTGQTATATLRVGVAKDRRRLIRERKPTDPICLTNSNFQPIIGVCFLPPQTKPQRDDGKLDDYVPVAVHSPYPITVSGCDSGAGA